MIGLLNSLCGIAKSGIILLFYAAVAGVVLGVCFGIILKITEIVASF